MEENTLLITKRIANNLTALRKRSGLTQAEVAEKINYSDKSVSKWESAGGVPDVFILMQLAKLYGVTLDEIVGEKLPAPKKESRTGLHTLIMLLSAGIVWLVAVCAFTLLQFLPTDGPWWMAFIYALPLHAVVFIVFASVWKYKILNFISITALIWTVLLSVYLTLSLIYGAGALWSLFLIGVPLQVLEILWAFFRYSVFKRRNLAKAPKAEREEKE